MTRGVLAVVTLLLSSAGVLQAQGTGIIRGRVLDAGGQRPVADAQVIVLGTAMRAMTNAAGDFTIPGVPPGTRTVSARRIGYAPGTQSVTVTAGQTATVTITLEQSASQLEAIVVTALGQTAQQRSLGTAQQTVAGPAIAETQRENFVNALQGRVAGVNVTSSSGVPGASSVITIRGVSSLGSSNQPLFVVDGLPIDNKTLNTGALASGAGGSAISFENRGIDFSNRASDINPEDIETLTVLKGPEASALYGIDAANGAIVITTKRGKAGRGGFEYSNSFRYEHMRGEPEVQRVYSPSGFSAGIFANNAFNYFGAPYADTTRFYNNIKGFFRDGITQKHNLTFSGGAQDGRVNYRIASGFTKQEGVVPNSDYKRFNLTGASQAQVKNWLNVDLSMSYIFTDNNQPFKGEGGPLLGLLVWPATDNAADYLTPGGIRRRLILSTTNEIDNPYFNVYKNKNNSKNNRLITNVGFILAPWSWGNLRSNIGSDLYTNTNQIVRHPESQWGFNQQGVLDEADDVTRNINVQTLLNVNSRRLFGGLSVGGFVGNSVQDLRSDVDALLGQLFLDPNFVSVNNTQNRSSRTTISQRRLVSAFGQATLDWNKYLYVTITGRNDWTSTIPKERNSFFYPSISSSFVFSDAFPSVAKYMTGKLRAAYAEVGKDAAPYSYTPSLEYKTTANGGYGYGFTGPNRNLKPEFKSSAEFGTELSFFDDRLGFDATYYRSQTRDQIVPNIRGSYGTGFILFNLNGAVTRNTGVEMTLRGTPIESQRFSWDVLANFDKHHGKTVSLPHELPEFYNSDTWLVGNLRNGTKPGSSTESITGFFYLRNKDGKLLIDPTTGLPITSPSFIDAGFDRTPKYSIGLTNTFRYGSFQLTGLLDFRRGGDVFNATQWYLFRRGLDMSTLDRETPRVIDGVLRDGRENSANPTVNTIVVVPAVQTTYYTSASEELFVEKNINWMRLRDVTLTYRIPARFAQNASVYVTGTDLFLVTNYTGLDPVVNGNSAATGGSGAAGIDYGNFPMPRGLNVGVKLGF